MNSLKLSETNVHFFPRGTQLALLRDGLTLLTATVRAAQTDVFGTYLIANPSHAPEQVIHRLSSGNDGWRLDKPAPPHPWVLDTWDYDDSEGFKKLCHFAVNQETGEKRPLSFTPYDPIDPKDFAAIVALEFTGLVRRHWLPGEPLAAWRSLDLHITPTLGEPA